MEDINLLAYQQFVMLYRKLVKNPTTSPPFRVSLSNFKNRPPIISYGCILQCKDKFCCLKRKFSVEYTDFLRGNYRDSHLYFLLSCMTLQERELLTKDFGYQWTNHCGKAAAGGPYENAYCRWSEIKPHLPQLLAAAPCIDLEGRRSYLWPKGRMDYRPPMQDRWCHSPTLDPFISAATAVVSDSEEETPLSCALREFKEETGGYEISELWSVSAHPIAENHLGTNSKNYQTYYFLFRCPNCEVHRFNPQPTVSVSSTTTTAVASSVREGGLDSAAPNICSSRLDDVRDLVTATVTDSTSSPVASVVATTTDIVGESIVWLTQAEIEAKFSKQLVDLFNSFNWSQPTELGYVANEWKVPTGTGTGSGTNNDRGLTTGSGCSDRYNDSYSRSKGHIEFDDSNY